MNEYSSKWELAYSRYLDVLVADGTISRWYYEPIKFNLAMRTTYAPDFMLIYPNGMIEFVEVKGFRREDALVKFKIAASAHPEFSWRMIEKDKTSPTGWRDIPAFTFAHGSSSIVKEEDLKPKPQKSKHRATMSYDQMLIDPVLSPLIQMKGKDLRSIRTLRSLSSTDMADVLGMTERQYLNLEADKTRLYHYRHVIALNNLLRSPK